VRLIDKECVNGVKLDLAGDVLLVLFFEEKYKKKRVPQVLKKKAHFALKKRTS